MLLLWTARASGEDNIYGVSRCHWASQDTVSVSSDLRTSSMPILTAPKEGELWGDIWLKMTWQLSSLPLVSMSPTCIASYRDMQPLEVLKTERKMEGHEPPPTGKITILSDNI